MADPLTILGAAASITTLIEVLSKTVIALHTLHARYSSADFTFLNLIAQLTALKAALTRLQEWMDTDIDEVHHQLVMDLEVSVTCCRMLVRRIGDEVDKLLGDDDGSFNGEVRSWLSRKGKIMLVIKNGGLEELQRMADRQTGALGLLLTVCNCKAISDQKLLLEKKSTRKTFTRVKDDSSSLHVLRDSTSIYTRCTGYMSMISRTFEFDRELFVSKVYEKAFRVSMRATLGNMPREKKQQSAPLASRPKHNGMLSTPLPDYKHSENQASKRRAQALARNNSFTLGSSAERRNAIHSIDSPMGEREYNGLMDHGLEYTTLLRGTCGIILLEKSDSEQLPMKAVRLCHPELSLMGRERYRLLAMENIMSIMMGIIKTMSNSGSVMGDAANVTVKFLLQDIGCVQAGENIALERDHLVHSLWEDGIQPVGVSSFRILSSSPL